MQRKLGLTLGIVAAIAGILVFVGGSDLRPAVSNEAVDFEFRDFDGEVRHLSDFRGSPVVINFWASWCPACVSEMPDFARAHQQLGAEVVFLGLNMQEVSRTAAEDLVSQTGVAYQLGEDPDGAIFQSFNAIAMPTSILIGADGAVAEVHDGAIFGDDLIELIGRVLL